MNTIKLNKNYDINLDQFGQIAIVSDTDSVKQNVITALKLIKGEYIFNVLIGIPYFDFLGQSKANNEIFQEYVNQTVLAVIGVQQVISSTYTYDKNTRTYNYFLTVQINGENVDVNTL